MGDSQFGHGNPTERSLWRLFEILREIASSPKQREPDAAADALRPGDQMPASGAKHVGAAMTENSAMRTEDNKAANPDTATPVIPLSGRIRPSIHEENQRSTTRKTQKRRSSPKS
jgi:hypothetical protein